MRLTSNKRISGQTMTEMIIIVGLIAIGCIAAVAIFGKQIKQTFKRLTGGLAGESVGADSASGDVDTDVKKMGEFDSEAAD